MKRRILVGALLLTTLALVAARPNLEDLQAQIDALAGGLGGHQIVTYTTFVPSTTFSATATAQCPSGKLAFGGGGHLTFAPGSGGSGHAVTQSYPNTPSSWSVYADTPNPPNGDWYLTAYVICARSLP